MFEIRNQIRVIPLIFLTSQSAPGQPPNVDLDAVIKVTLHPEPRSRQGVSVHGEENRVLKDFPFDRSQFGERPFEEEREAHHRVDGHVDQRHVPVDEMVVDLHRTRVRPSA